MYYGGVHFDLVSYDVVEGDRSSVLVGVAVDYAQLVGVFVDDE